MHFLDIVDLQDSRLTLVLTCCNDVGILRIALFQGLCLQTSVTQETQSWHHIETSQLICRANQLTGFHIMATLAFNELMLINPVTNKCFLIMIQIS